MLSYGVGKVQEETGSAMFLLKFTAQVFKPMRGEVLDAGEHVSVLVTAPLKFLCLTVVSTTHAHGFHAMIGPLKVFVPPEQLPGDFQHRPEDQSWTSADESVRLVEGTAVRLRILQIKSIDGFCMGTINDDFLGVIQSAAEAI